MVFSPLSLWERVRVRGLKKLRSFPFRSPHPHLLPEGEGAKCVSPIIYCSISHASRTGTACAVIPPRTYPKAVDFRPHLLAVCKRTLSTFRARTDRKPTVVKPLGRRALQQPMIDDDLLAGEYRIQLRGPLSVDYLGRTTAQEIAIPGGGRRLVFWAPETLVKLAIPEKIALGAAMVHSLD